MTIQAFRKLIWVHYKQNKRSLPWRRTRDPYKILVSEVMLQQTQSYRVEPKYKAFISRFPTIGSLAQASSADVLREWQGLGYNRRALYLKKCAEQLVGRFNGKFPKDLDKLLSLPGIGLATAGDMLAFAWNIPTVFIETNIRTVFIHFFFKDVDKVSDKEILPLVEKTLDRQNPREWYWALFDYGVMLKKKRVSNSKSAHYTKQTKFIGSFRQKRAQAVRLLLEKPRTAQELAKNMGIEEAVVAKIMESLIKDGLARRKQDAFFID
jgi:A/G-specific adenine glycosylase